MLPWLGSAADPARVHTEGHSARVAIEVAREQIAALLGTRPREVVFTSGATESVTAAVWGATERGEHLVVPAVEHSCVRESSARHLTTVVGVDGIGRVDPEEMISAIRPDTALVHLQWGNHEVATVQPVADIVAGCHEHDVLVHVDAAAAAGHVPIDFRSLGADLVSVSAHKMGGPPGVGALLVRRGLRLRPMLLGGSQERARRAGYENVPAIVGWGAAAELLLSGGMERERVEAAERTQRILHAVASGALGEGVTAYGDTSPAGRLPHIVCLGVSGVEAEPVLLGLDQAGVAVHSGSACSSEELEPSPILEAMGVDAERSIRVSVGWNTTDDDIDAFLRAFPTVVSRLRALYAG